MNKVFGSYDGPYLWAFRAAGAAAGASVTRLALPTLKVSPWSPAGIALQAGAALAGGRFYPMAVSEGIQYALDKMPPEWAWRANQAAGMSVGAAIGLAAFMGAQWSWYAVAIKVVCAAAVMKLHFQLFEHIYCDRLLELLNPRAFVRAAPLSRLIEISTNLSEEYLKTPAALAFLDEFAKRGDIDPFKISAFFNRFYSETIREFDPEELSDRTVRELTCYLHPEDRTYFPNVFHLLQWMRAHPEKQIAIFQQRVDWIRMYYVLNNYLFGEQYPTLADETIDFIMSKKKPTACEVAYCARQRKDLAPRLAQFTSDELLEVVGDSYEECWEHSLIKVVVESLPDDRLLVFSKALLMSRSRWFAFALRHILNSRDVQPDDDTLVKWAKIDHGAACVVVAARPSLYADFDSITREIIDTYIEPKTLISVIQQTESDPYPWRSHHTLLKTCSLAEKTVISGKVKAWAQNKCAYMIQRNALNFFLSAELPVLKSLNGESLEESHRCFAFARGVTVNIDPQDARIKDFKALYDLWHANDTHFFDLEYFRTYFRTIRQTVQDQENLERIQEVLFWLAHFVQKTDGFEEIPETIVQALNAYPKMYGRILGLWERGKEGGNVRLEFLLNGWPLSKKETFTKSYGCSLLKTYHDFICRRFIIIDTSATNSFTVIDPAIRSLASHLAYEDVTTHQTAVWNAPAPFTNMQSHVFFKICHLLSARERCRFGMARKELSTIIFKSHHQHVWCDLGSLRAIKNMYMLYKEIQPEDALGIIYSLYKETHPKGLSEEALILRHAILYNLPHLRRK